MSRMSVSALPGASRRLLLISCCSHCKELDTLAIMREPLKTTFELFAAIAIITVAIAVRPCAAATDLNRPPINYEKTKPDNDVSRLQKSLDDGTLKLTHDEEQGYLKSVL